MDYDNSVNCFYSVAVNSLDSKSATHPRISDDDATSLSNNYLYIIGRLVDW